MRTNNSIVRWNWALLGCCVLLLICSRAQGQTTSTGRLTVTGRVQGSIGLVFNNNPAVGTNGFCPLTNAGTNSLAVIDLWAERVVGLIPTPFAGDNLQLNPKLDCTSDSQDGPLITGERRDDGVSTGKPA